MNNDQSVVMARQQGIIDAMRNPRTRQTAFQKYDSGQLNDARIRDIFQRRKDKILNEMDGIKNKDGRGRKVMPHTMYVCVCVCMYV